MRPFRTSLIMAAAGLCVATVSAFATPAATGGGSSSPTAENRRLVAEAFDRWAAGGGNFFHEVLAEDVVWTIEGSGRSAGEFRGRAAFLDRAVRPFAARLSTPVRPTSVTVWADADHVIARWEGSGVAGDGRPYDNSYAWIFRMRNGKAAEVTAFLDLAPYDDVLRRVPAPPAQ